MTDDAITTLFRTANDDRDVEAERHLLEAGARGLAAFHGGDYDDPGPDAYGKDDAYRDDYRRAAEAVIEPVVAVIAARVLWLLHAEVQPRVGYAEIADLIDARAEEWADRAKEETR